MVEGEPCPRCPGRLFVALRSFYEGSLIRYQVLCPDCHYWECRHVEQTSDVHPQTRVQQSPDAE